MDLYNIWNVDRYKIYLFIILNTYCSYFQKSNLEKLSLLGYEEVVDRILRQVCEL